MFDTMEKISLALEASFQRGYLQRDYEVLGIIKTAYENKLIDADSFINLKNLLIKD